MKASVLLLAVLVACGAHPFAAAAATEEEIQAAIDDGLVWLAAEQNTIPGDDFGSWGVSYKVAKTGMAVKKFEHDAILREYESPFDPDYMYHEVVEQGLDYIFQHAQILDITGDPADTDSDGIAVFFPTDSGRTTYPTGIVLMAIAESTTPERIVDVEGSLVNGWTYGAVAVDAMNWLAYAQISPGGGWGYSLTDPDPDQSNSGYATLGLGFFAALPPDGFGGTLPAFMTNQFGGPGQWVDWIQNDVNGDPFDGGSGYSSPNSCVNILETGNLIFEMALFGDLVGTQRVQDAIDYLVRTWGDDGLQIGGNWCLEPGWPYNYQAMFTMMKGLEAYQIDLIGPGPGIDWFDEVSTFIVDNQNVNGSWGPDFWDDWGGGDAVLSTCWALLTLQKAAPAVVLDVAFDIKPTSCPNPLNSKGKGLLPAAILGTEDFDVATVDPDSLKLEGVAPARWEYEDVATPVGDEADTCDCTTEGPDGYMDLTLKFKTQEIVGALGPVTDGEVRILTLTGVTYEGQAFEAQDCVITLVKNRARGIVTQEIGQRDERLGGSITTISLGGGYPNPFTSETRIFLSLPEPSDVRLAIYDVSGKKVRTLVDRTVAAGHHSIHWNGTDESGAPVASGVYFCRMSAEGREFVTKLMLIE